jgi:hypothetical protein
VTTEKAVMPFGETAVTNISGFKFHFVRYIIEVMNIMDANE